MLNKRQNSNGDSLKSSNPPTPVAPSPEELLEAMTERIAALCREADKEFHGKVKNYLAEAYQDFFRNYRERNYWFYPEINMLEILDNRIDKWKKEKVSIEQTIKTPIDFWKNIHLIHELMDNFYQAAREKHSSYPEDYWIIKNALEILQKYQDYPFDEKADRDLLERARERFPDIDIIRQIDRKIIWWNDHPSALTAGKSPRIQLWEFFETEDEHLKKPKNKVSISE